MSAIQNLKRIFHGDTQRQYYVYGEIIFIFKKPFDDDRSSSPELRKQMRHAITAVDELYPWRDVASNGTKLASIGALYFYADQFNNSSIPELNVWFRIEPTARYVSRGQTYAYEKYMETLVQKLAEREEFVGKATVRSICHFSKSSAEYRG